MEQRDAIPRSNERPCRRPDRRALDRRLRRIAQAGAVLTQEGKSQELCESIPGRLFVATTVGSECIAYWVTKGNENRRQAVFFIDGDLPPVADAAAFEEHMQKTESGIRKLMQKWADKLHVRYVYLARPGLHGSSGDHKERMKPHETLILGAAAKLLKDKLGLDSIALAGQSRGSTIAASLLTLKLHDVKCAVLGSGAFEIVDLEYDNHAKAHHPIEKAKLRKIMYDPSAHVDGIEPDPARRIFVLGDREDPKAAFPQQTHFVESLKAAGNHRSRSRSRPTITMAPHVSRSRRRPPASTVWQTRRSSPPSPRCSRSTSSACPIASRTTLRAVRRRRRRWCSTPRIPTRSSKRELARATKKRRGCVRK